MGFEKNQVCPQSSKTMAFAITWGLPTLTAVNSLVGALVIMDIPVVGNKTTSSTKAPWINRYSF